MDAHLNFYLDKNEEVIALWAEYVDREVANGANLKTVSRHVLGLYHGCPGARLWRRYLSENMHKMESGGVLFSNAAQYIE